MPHECLQCGKEVPQTDGKKKRQFCDINCRSKHYYKKKNGGKEPGKRGRPVGSTKQPKDEKTPKVPPKKQLPPPSNPPADKPLTDAEKRRIALQNQLNEI